MGSRDGSGAAGATGLKEGWGRRRKWAATGEDWRREAANERGAEECCGGCGHTTGATTGRLGARVAVVTVGSDSGGGGGVKGWRAACGVAGVRGRDSRRFTPVGLGQLGQGWLVSCDLAGKPKAARPLGKVPERGLATQARRVADAGRGLATQAQRVADAGVRVCWVCRVCRTSEARELRGLQLECSSAAGDRRMAGRLRLPSIALRARGVRVLCVLCLVIVSCA